jgi:hypothetical protein
MQEEEVGLTAGKIWEYLQEAGPVSISRVVREVKGGRQLVLMSLGWLAREGKLVFQEDGRRRLVGLKR